MARCSSSPLQSKHRLWLCGLQAPRCLAAAPSSASGAVRLCAALARAKLSSSSSLFYSNQPQDNYMQGRKKKQPTQTHKRRTKTRMLCSCGVDLTHSASAAEGCCGQSHTDAGSWLPGWHLATPCQSQWSLLEVQTLPTVSHFAGTPNLPPPLSLLWVRLASLHSWERLGGSAGGGFGVKLVGQERLWRDFGQGLGVTG